MKLALLATLPPVFTTSAGYALIWAIEPDYLRERAGRFLPVLFGTALAFGELMAWLAN